MNKTFPVHALDRNIESALKKIITADISGALERDKLESKIFFTDQVTSVKNVACIKPREGGRAQVSISSAYCQFLWLICFISITEIDFQIAEKMREEVGLSKEEFLKQIDQTLSQPRERIQGEIKERCSDEKLDPERYCAYLKCLAELYQEDYHKKQADYTDLLHQLLGKSDFNFDDFCKVNIKTLYSERVNSVYCFGISFVLLHELNHLLLGHIDKETESMEDEIAADSASFWSIYYDITEEEKFSANSGILCVLFSLLFLNPQMESDGIHPLETDRIFWIYDEIVGLDNGSKYTQLLVGLFSCWAEFFAISNFPKDLSYTDNSIDKIRKFLSLYQKEVKEIK